MKTRELKKYTVVFGNGDRIETQAANVYQARALADLKLGLPDRLINTPATVYPWWFSESGK